MGWIFIPIIFTAILLLFICYVFALKFIWKGQRNEAKHLWNAVWFLGTVTTIILLIYNGLRESGEMFITFLIMWLIVSFIMISSIIFALIHKVVKKENSYLGKPILITFGVGFVFLILQVVTVTDTENQTQIDDITAAAETKEQEEKETKEKEEKEAKEQEEKKKEGLIPVTLYRVVDGDSVNVYDDNGEELKLRLLLIDTPETVHPQKPVEPYGKEASERMIELVNSADQLYIEYDEGEKTDHYDRHLVYLYADDTNVHEALLEEGLARVGYVYEQKRYLSEFRAIEQKAKDKEIGIWSIPDYVNSSGEGFNSEDEEETETNEHSKQSKTDHSSSNADDGDYNFANCTELNEVFPDGVSSDHPAYQSKMDRDRDGWACE